MRLLKKKTKKNKRYTFFFTEKDIMEAKKLRLELEKLVHFLEISEFCVTWHIGGFWDVEFL